MIRAACIAFVLCIALMAVAGCTTTGGYPPVADVNAVVERKPIPTADVLTDPAASDRHLSAVEAWADRIHDAGLRLCRFYKRTGMEIDCP